MYISHWTPPAHIPQIARGNDHNDGLGTLVRVQTVIIVVTFAIGLGWELISPGALALIGGAG